LYELKVLSAIAESRTDFDAVREHIEREALSPMGLAVLDAVETYYDSDVETQAIDWDILTRRMERKFEAVPKHLKQCREYLQQVTLQDASNINVIQEVLDGRMGAVLLALADASLAQDKDRVGELMKQYEELRDADTLDTGVEEEYAALSLEDLETFFEPGGRIKVAPAKLNEYLKGGLRRGHHLFLCARPEVGKSLISLNMAGGFARQGLVVLYIGNEDPLPDLIVRLLSNLTGMTEEYMFANKEEAMELAMTNGYKNILFIGMSPGTIGGIDALCRKHKPDVIMIDQLRNVAAGKAESNTQRLDTVARGARGLGRKHNAAVISIGQAGEAAEGELYLNMNHVDGSKTGIPGACDVMVMVGMNEEFERTNRRMICMPKNKVGGVHARFSIDLIPELTRVRSIATPSGGG
jgi:archaellum biogenesis ATPase FlaH